jgi:hypothetical protein
MCNAGGDATEGFMGGSGCWAPLRGKIGGFEGEEETVRVFDVDVNVLKVGVMIVHGLTIRTPAGCTRLGRTGVNARLDKFYNQRKRFTA